MLKWAPPPSERSRQRLGTVPQYYSTSVTLLPCSYLILSKVSLRPSSVSGHVITLRQTVLCPWILPFVLLLLGLYRLAMVRCIVCSISCRPGECYSSVPGTLSFDALIRSTQPCITQRECSACSRTVL